MNIPTEYLITDPTKLVKGQKLWSAQFGEVIFQYATISEETIEVEWNGEYLHYFLDGRVNKGDKQPLLYLKSPFESQERVILVRDSEDEKWQKRVLIKIALNKAVCWQSSDTIEGSKKEICTSYWNFWKELEPQESIPEYTMEEIAVKLGHDFKIKK